MKTLFEERCSATHLYEEKKQTSLSAPEGKLKGRVCKKLGSSYVPLGARERLVRVALLVAKLALCLLLVPLFYASYRKSISILFKEIRRGQEKIIHYAPPAVPAPNVSTLKKPIPLSPTPEKPAQPLPTDAHRLKTKAYERESKEQQQALQEWVLTQPLSEANIEDMRSFITFMVDKGRSFELSCEGSFVEHLHSLDDTQLSSFTSLLDFKGPARAFKPLSYVFQKLEHYLQTHAAEKIGNRLKTILEALSLEQVKACAQDSHFWCLLFKRPQDAAESLNANKWGILATNREKQEKELLKIIGLFPEDDQLYPKLKAIAPHTSTFIHQAMVSKISRLGSFKWTREGNVVTADEKKMVRLELKKQLEDAVLKDSLNQKKLARKSAPPAPPAHKNIPKPFVLDKPTRLDWSEAQYLEFLRDKLYTHGHVGEKEKGEVFHWILEKGKALLDECQKEIKDFLADSQSREVAFERLKFVPNDQFPFFLALLGEDLIEDLWRFEAITVVGQTEENLKVSRLKIAWTSLSDRQLLASSKSAKFFELLCTYPEDAIFAFTPAQLKLLSEQTERETDILRAFIWFAKKLHGEVPEFLAKFQVYVSLSTPREEEADKKEIRRELHQTLEGKKRLVQLHRSLSSYS